MSIIIIPILMMLILSLLKIPVVAAIIFSAITAGLMAGMGIHETLVSFNQGIEHGATIAMSYALLGSFAAALGKTGLPDWLCARSSLRLSKTKSHLPKVVLICALGIAAIASQNIIPIHIAFIPILVPPLLLLMDRLALDRRLIACVLTFGLVTTYMLLPMGFGAIYLKEVLLKNIAYAGGDINHIAISHAMWLPALGMFVGLLIAIFFSYRKPRHYISVLDSHLIQQSPKKPRTKTLIITPIALLTTCLVQINTDSMMMGALMGFVVFVLFGVIKLEETDGIFLDGLKMMASIGFVMISAQGFSQVLMDTQHIDILVNAVSKVLADDIAIGVFLMLLTGLIITLGIGSSFSTVPIIAAVFVPIALELGLSSLAIVALIGTAGALGDAGSPASDSTLGPTSGLNADGQHDHIRDSVLPTFLHFNIPLLIFGWIAVMWLK